jgi:two-component system cell cycle sensor histidine kinase/response regulator CckA
VTLRQALRLMQELSTSGPNLHKVMVDVLELQEIDAQQTSAPHAATSAYVALTLYFLAGVAFQFVFGNQDYGTGTIPWFPLTGLAIVAVYSNGWLAMPILFCASVIGSALAGSLFASPKTVLSEAGITVLCCAIGSLVLRRMGRADSVTIKVRDLGRMLGVIAVTSILIGTFVYLIRYNHQSLETVDTWLFCGQIVIGHVLGAVSIAPFLWIHVIPTLSSPEDPTGLGSIEWSLTARATQPSRITLAERYLQLTAAAALPWFLLAFGFARAHNTFFLVLILTLWIATRQGIRGVAAAVMLSNIATLWSLRNVVAPAATNLQSQIMMLGAGLVGLSVGCLVSEIAVASSKLEHQTVILNALQDHSPLATVVHDANGKILLTNRAFTNLFGYGYSETIGRHVDEILSAPEGEEASQFTQQVLVEPISKQTVRLRRDRTRVTVEMMGIPFLVKSKLVGGIGLYRDITKQKKLEEELLLAQKLQAVGHLAGAVAHDFNNSLGVVQGYSEYILERLSKDDPLRHSVEEIAKASDRATDLTKQLLTFGRKQVIQPRATDLVSLVNDLSSMLSRLIGEHIRLNVYAASHVSAVTVDPGQVEQVIINLAVNARDAMAQGGKLSISIANRYVEAYDDGKASIPAGRYVSLAMADTGTGISPEILANIFDPFFTTKDKSKGTGLGLATAYGIILQANGFITVDTREGLGSTFTILLPATDLHVEQRQKVPEQTGMPRGSETILVVEDEPVLRKMVVDFLESTGYKVLNAESASEAVGHVQLFPGAIDLVLTDIVMPDMNGADLARFLCALRAELRVLYMSGYSDGALGDKFVLPKDVAFLQKPFSRMKLAHKLREILDSNLIATADRPVGGKSEG